MRQITGPQLDNVAFCFKLYWDHSHFMVVAANGFALKLTPDHLADLSRELMRASVTKGED